MSVDPLIPEPVAPTPTLGKLTKVDPYSVWPHEAHHFTPWLAENLDLLAEALGIDVELITTEHQVGAFFLDIFGRDVTHDHVLIIENQLTKSDHSHLGQLLTYAAGTGAATIVWIAPLIKGEHRQALTWLNEQTGTSTYFFGVEVEVVTINGVDHAPLFSVVVMPNDWQKTVQAAQAATQAHGKGPQYYDFWSEFLLRIHKEKPMWSKAKQGTQASWFPMSVGAPQGCSIVSSFAAGGKLRSELYIDRSSQAECKELFDHIHTMKSVFEQAYGCELSWERLDEKKASRIADYSIGKVESAEDHQSYMNWFIDAGTRMRAALKEIGMYTAPL